MAGTDCLCGCGDLTRGGQYRPGHDAKLASQVKQRVLDGDLTLAQARGQLPTVELADQMASWVERALTRRSGNLRRP